MGRITVKTSGLEEILLQAVIPITHFIHSIDCILYLHLKTVVDEVFGDNIVHLPYSHRKIPLLRAPRRTIVTELSRS